MLTAEWQAIVTGLAAAVYELRCLLGWSQQELADRAVTSQGTISRLESGTVPGMPLHSVVVVLRALGASADALALGLSRPQRALVTFAQTLDPTFRVTLPLDPELVRLVHAYHRLAPAQRAPVVALLEAMAPDADVREETGT